MVRKAKPLRGADAVLKARNMEGDVRILYENQLQFEDVARQFGIFEEWKVFRFSFLYIQVMFNI